MPAWRCERCERVHRSNPSRCASCGHTVLQQHQTPPSRLSRTAAIVIVGLVLAAVLTFYWIL